MGKKLVIVESPAKIKTISKILGQDFHVMSCIGHFRELSKKEGTGNLGIDLNNDCKLFFDIQKGKSEAVKLLKSNYKKYKKDKVYIATDLDREGEAIAWHIKDILKLRNDDYERVVFSEITKKAVLHSFDKPRKINNQLLYAYMARRTLDRIIGFTFSPILWKSQGNRKLSVGRVQSVALKIVADREKEIQEFSSKSIYKVSAVFNIKKSNIKAKSDLKLDNENQILDFLEGSKTSTFSIDDITRKTRLKKPPPPFITSTLQQDASSKLGYGVQRTMSLAQSLYQKGKITYMRTDSTNLSDQAIKETKGLIEKEFGKNYSFPQNYNTKSKSAQEAHEAIRPTNVNEKEPSECTVDELKIYNLIWKRMVASQMVQAKVEDVKLFILDNSKNVFVSECQNIIFDGFLKLNTIVSDTDKDDVINISNLNKNDEVLLNEITVKEDFTTPPRRYSEASLVKQLEKLGIGRPSTFAQMIQTNINKNYISKGVSKGEEKGINVFSLKDKEIVKTNEIRFFNSNRGKLVATDLGQTVNVFNNKNLHDFINYDFTAKLEMSLDKIMANEIKWQEMVKGFYENVQKLTKTKDFSGQRKVYTEGDKPVYVRLGRYGPLIQIGEQDDEGKQHISLKGTGFDIDTITEKDIKGIILDYEKNKQKDHHQDPDIIKLISESDEENPFIISLKKQLELGKKLTLKQQQAAKKVLDSENVEEEIENSENIYSDIEGYEGDNRFINSLKRQYKFKKSLSFKQLKAAEKFFTKQKKDN